VSTLSRGGSGHLGDASLRRFRRQSHASRRLRAGARVPWWDGWRVEGPPRDGSGHLGKFGLPGRFKGSEGQLDVGAVGSPRAAPQLRAALPPRVALLPLRRGPLGGGDGRPHPSRCLAAPARARPWLPLLRRAPAVGAGLRRCLGVLVRDLFLRIARRALPAQAGERTGRPDRGGLRACACPRSAALDQGLPDDLRIPLVAALAAPAPRLPRLPPARDLRRLDEARRRAQRLLGALPLLRTGHERVPVAARRRDARGTSLRQGLEPALRGRRTPTPRRLLPATGLRAAIRSRAVGIGRARSSDTDGTRRERTARPLSAAPRRPGARRSRAGPDARQGVPRGPGAPRDPHRRGAGLARTRLPASDSGQGAEGERFELSIRLTTDNGFRDHAGFATNGLFLPTTVTAPLRAPACPPVSNASPVGGNG
jgi:hypothetical protein